MKSEEQYNKVESKIIEAANGSQYPYNDAAWQRMELLLDKKKKRRTIFFWLWPLVFGALLFGSYLFFIPKQITNSTTGVTLNNEEKDLKKKIAVVIPKPLKNALTNNINVKQEKLKYSKIIRDNEDKKSNKSKKNILPGVKTSFNKSLINTVNNNAYVKNTIFDKSQKKYKTTSKTVAVISNGEIVSEEEEPKNVEFVNSADIALTPTLIEPSAKVNDIKTVIKAANKNTIITKDTGVKTTKQNTTVKQKKQSNKKVLASLYVVAVKGAEANTTKPLSFANTTITPVWGIDIGYKLNKKWSIQTGFHSSAKKYIAGPTDYNEKIGTYLSMVNIIKVDANCRVYEIPLSVHYNWKQKKSFTFFSAVGFSGYIMKRENYNFTFERNNYVFMRPYSYTGNKHLFATIYLSSGIEKKLNRHFYLQATPIIHIPIVGVGQGSVKLYTKSVEIGLKYFPFRK